MSFKVNWKKGMRLSVDVFNALDATIEDKLRLSMLMAGGGRAGLFPTGKPFELSVNVTGDWLEVVSLTCCGLTRNGSVVDIDFDAANARISNNRVMIPSGVEGQALLLVVRMLDNAWRELDDIYSEPAYVFELIGENSIIGDDMLPVGCLVNQYGWRLNESEFVPPCLYISAHRKYIEACSTVKDYLRHISDCCLAAPNCVARHLLMSVWNATANSLITLDKTVEILSPNALLGEIQKVVSGFVVGCAADEYLSLESPEPFVMFVRRPYDNANVYANIMQGIELLSQIVLKMEHVSQMTEEEKPPVQPEKPEPAPKPKPVAKPTGRKRWEGIEI